MTPTERRIAYRIIANALAQRFTVTVFDGEDFNITNGTDAAAILAAMAQTDQDLLIIRRANNARLGSIHLIYGNGGDGEDVVSDHNDNPIINALVA